MMDDWKMKDPVIQAGMLTIEVLYLINLKSQKQKRNSTRVGLAFPVSDEIVFHLQYGKFAQMLNLICLMLQLDMSLVWGGQNYS